MTLRTRRFLYLSFAAIFFIVAPLTVLYTTGIRWNYYKNKLEKIGNLVIRTVPRDVTITLNDEIFKKTTPWRFNNLLSNRYNIQITSEGYHSWQKTLAVNSGETTFAEHIFLFKKDLSVKQILDNVDFWIYEPAHTLILFQKNNSLQLYNLTNGQIQKIADLSETIIDATWSKNMQVLLITTPSQYYFWNNNEPTKLQLINAQRLIENCNLYADKTTSLICANETQLFEVNPYTNTRLELFTEQTDKILDFYSDQGIIYFLEKNSLDGNVYLRINKPNFPNDTYPDYLLPDSTDYELVSVEDKLAVILDHAHQKLYLLHLENNEDSFNKSSQIYNDISDVFFSTDGTIIFFNDWEVWTKRGEQLALITRQSGSIKNVLWYPSNNHILLVQPNSLEFIELDERDQRNRAKILETEGIKKVQFDKTGTKIIYGVEKDNTQTIFTGDILPIDAGDLLPN